MFAVIKTGGKQYKVRPEHTIRIEKVSGDAGARIEFKEVLIIGSEESRASIIGSPIVKGASVVGEIVSQTRSEKIIIFKKKRRQNYRRKNGHRQDITEIKILDIKKAE